MARPARYATIDDAILAPRPEFVPAMDPAATCRRCHRPLLVAERCEYRTVC